MEQERDRKRVESEPDRNIDRARKRQIVQESMRKTHRAGETDR